jgi:hypothetical protein
MTLKEGEVANHRNATLDCSAISALPRRISMTIGESFAGQSFLKAYVGSLLPVKTGSESYKAEVRWQGLP